MNHEKELTAVLVRLKADRVEKNQGRSLWRSLMVIRPEGRDLDPWTALLLEEAVTWRIFSQRLMKAVPEEPMLNTEQQDGRPVKPSVHPAFDAYAKSQERFRKVMKELKEELDVRAGEETEGVPAMMVSILKEAEGVLENALRPGKRGEGLERSGRDGGADRDVAEDF